MSCQQLIQEDPYVFTDTISNSASFMQQNNSQTKYVPLSRQTIYSRQFRQHEPTIASSENVSINGHSHQKSPSPNRKIIISATSVNQRKNGLTNGFVSSKSPRTSPKFFKSHQLSPTASFKVPDGQYIVNSSTTHHSITVSSQPAPLNQQQQQQHSGHVASTCENGIINNTGIKQGPLNGKCHAIINRKGGVNGKHQLRKHDKAAKLRTNSKPLKKSLNDKFSDMRHHMIKSRPKSQNVIVEPVSIALRRAPEVQSSQHLDLDSIFYVPPLSPLHHLENEIVQTLSRDGRLSQRKMQLRRRMHQFIGIQQYRTTEQSRMQFSKTLRLLKHLDRAKEEMFKRPHRSCQFDDCIQEAIVAASHCIDHILLADKEQLLVRQCCFLYSHGEQCRMPVYDIMATLAICSEHQNAPAHQLIDPAKPKKATQMQRKRAGKEPMLKKNGKKKTTSKLVIPGHRPTMIIHPSDIQKPKVLIQPKPDIPADNHQFIHHNSGNLLASSQSSYGSITSASDDLYLKQDLMTICENSYESSEDTGVGGLSENELMTHDVIGSLDMESSDELTKVLSSLATANELDDLLTEPLQSRDDEEYLDRAIQEVSSVGIDQIAITAFDHLDGLDMLEMMDQEEQRQMFAAASNLISMSGMQSFLSNHDQDYAAMPSPMMS